MKRSIRRTLILWHGGVLFVVIMVYGGALYLRQRDVLYGEVEAALRAQAQAIASAMEWDEVDGFEMELPYDSFSPSYFLIVDSENKVLASSPSVPKRAREWRMDTVQTGYREVAVEGARHTRILVGRNTGSVEAELEIYRGSVLKIGFAAFFLAALGGSFLVIRVLRPIDRMTKSAERISAENLSERIDIGKTESELGKLASTLNDTFDRLQKSFDRQTSFTADASHELRTPLSVLQSNIEVALKKDRSSAEYRETLETCLRAAQRMKGVVEGLLTLARTDAGSLKLNYEKFALKPVVEEAVEQLQPLASARNIEIHRDTKSVDILGDRARLAEVVTNLVSNAIRYNKEGGRVDVSLRGEDGEVVLRVRDSGIGISKEDVPRIFERFYRVDKARSRESGGTGLGLAITKWIVEAHIGTVTVTSDLSQGTEFTVRLPMDCR